MTIERLASLGGRLALSAGFLSAVGDRFGLWGAFGAPRVAWGDWERFVTYTGSLNWFLPDSLVSPIAIVATLAELTLAILLLTGHYLRWVAYASAVLLLLFAVAMTVALGVKAPLDYSVFAAAAAALLLGASVPEQEKGERPFTSTTRRRGRG